MRKIHPVGWAAIAAVLIGIAIGATLIIRSLTAGPTLEDASAACGDAGRIEDDGATLVLAGYGDALTDLLDDDAELEDAMADIGLTSVEDMACVLEELQAPTAVIEHMSSTRALDGTQSDDWEGYEAQWTYHPDDGLNIIVTER
ncbi:hypothetical protein [Jiangella muralis]|uniref:hypothetical protein n=1 Tax=Jiangella muralis TaxID=702383 RepID=UPI00069DE796|nr:hypothetical protein [Jiangella muralis]